MRWNYTCPVCGCNLDPGERCDCKENRKEAKELEKLQEELEKERDAVERNTIAYRGIPWEHRKYA